MPVYVPPGLTIQTQHFIHGAYSYIRYVSYYRHYSPLDLSNGSTHVEGGNMKTRFDLQMRTFIPSIHVQKLRTVNSVCIWVSPPMICNHMLPLERWTSECSLFLESYFVFTKMSAFIVNTLVLK